MAKQDSDIIQRLTLAYEDMLEAVHGVLVSTEEEGGKTLKVAIEHASEQLTSIGKVSKDDAAEVADWLERDLSGAGEHMREETSELKDWFHFDLELIEQQLMDMFAAAADQTAVQLNELKQQAAAYGEWKAGEITGPGTLVCQNCGKAIHFHKVSHIPPCPGCFGSHFKRP